MKTFDIYFQGRPGDDRDMLAMQIIEQHDGMVVASGLFLPTSERDLQVEVSDDRMRACVEALRNKGFKVEHRPDVEA